MLTRRHAGTPGPAGAILASRYGATAGENITAALQSACAAAVAQGLRAVVIDVTPVTVDDYTDCDGCRIIAHGVTLTAGNLANTAGIEGLTVEGQVQGRRSIHPSFTRDTAKKALIGVTSGSDLTQYLVTPKAGAGYVIAILRNNVTTNGADSLGTTGADATCWRVTSILHAVEVLTGYLATYSSRSNISGTDTDWTATSLTTGVPTYTTGTVYNYQRTTRNGGWLEWTVTVPEDGQLTVGILESSGSTSSATISVDGAAIDTAFTCVSTTTRRRIRRYTVTPGSHTVRITNNTASGLNVLGLWFAPLRDQRQDVPVDTYGIYRNNAQLDPISSNSANDYAIKVCDTDPGADPIADAIYGGSYHGGESSIVSEMRAKGAVVNPNGTDGTWTPLPAGKIVVAESFDLIQSCAIDWTSKIATGGNCVVRRHLVPLVGGYAERLTITSDAGLDVTQVYTCLMGLSENYQAIRSPVAMSLSGLTDGQRVALGNCGEVEYYYQNTNTTPTPDVVTSSGIRIQHTQHTDEETYQGGAFLWYVAGSYKKYYYSPINRGRRTIKSISSLTVVEVW